MIASREAFIKRKERSEKKTMGLADTLSGTLDLSVKVDLVRAQGTTLTGTDKVAHAVVRSLTEGTGSDQAKAVLTGTLAVTTGGITISLADSVDPFSTGGDDVPNEDPEGYKLRALVVENLDPTNFVTLALGTNAVTNWLAGTTPTLRIPKRGISIFVLPDGIDALNDGVDDEIKLTADTATCSCRVTAILG